MKTSRRTFIKQSALATVSVSGFGSLLLSEIGCTWAQTAQTGAGNLPPIKIPPFVNNVPSFADIPSFQEWLAPIYQNDKTAEINRVPYIATYYIQPKVDVGKDAVINYYVTDYHHSEYMFEDTSATFTVEYWVNGKKTTLKDVKVGDNNFTIQGLPKGKVLLALQVTDSKGRKSHRLFQEFLVVDPKEEVIPNDKTYFPDLQKFGIYNDDTHPVETTRGLTEMLKWASDNGYRKVLLPQGKYRLDENSTVQMATRLTLDMNGSTFKLNPSEVSNLVMFEMSQCFDSHVVNGIFEGDWKEREAGKLDLSEHVRGAGMSQDAQYCSFKDIKVVDITGYGTVTNIGKGKYVTAFKRILATSYLPGDIDEHGKPLDSSERLTTEKPIDISVYQKAHGFIQLGRYLGYQGNSVAGESGSFYGSWIYKAHFYDANHNYIESIEGHLYRRMYLPANAQYVRFTLFRSQVPSDTLFGVFDFRPPLNCAFINVRHENVRCVGMVPSGFNNLLVEGNTFEGCGYASAKCAFDAEDGWDLMQDLTFRNNIFGKNPNNEFVSVCGHNFIIENNVMGIYNNRRSKDFVVRNNRFKSANFSFAERGRTGCPRIHDNTIAGDAILTFSTSAQDKAYCIRDNTCQKGVGQRISKGSQPVAYFYKCKISDGALGAMTVKCDLKNIENSGGSLQIYGSTIDKSLLKISSTESLSVVAGCTITNSQFSNVKSAIVLKNNTLTDTTLESSSSWIETMEYILIGNKITTSKDYLISMGNSFRQILFENNTVTSTNPKFNGIVLKNPQAKKSKTLMVAITKSTFTGKGGSVLNVAIPPAAGTLLTIYAKGNTYTGLEAINDKAFDMKTVKLLEQDPPM